MQTLVERKLFVMGGGGFAMEPENLLLDRYILSLSDKPNPKICFIGTASGDSERYINNYYNAYNNLSCTPIHLSLFKPQTLDFTGLLLDQDIVHVGGGNTKNLLCLWKEWGLDLALTNAYKNGTVLSGMSAGMLCWFEQGTTDSFGGLDPLVCLGILKGSASPHFDGEVDRRRRFVELIKSGQLDGGIALDDGVGALYLNEKLSMCVSSRSKAGAYQFTSQSAKEDRLAVKYLGH